MNKSKILGTLYGIAIGDALGSITEFSTFSQIKKHFNNDLFSFKEQISFISKNQPLGTVTDDFSACYFVMKNILNNDGNFNRNIACEIITDWTNCDYYFEKFAGQTSKKAVNLIKTGKILDFGVNINFLGQTSNGGAMKVAPLALLARGNEQKALDFAIDMCYPTHFNSLAVAGACAVSLAVCEAQKEFTNIDKIINASINGAKLGQDFMEKQGRCAIGPKLSYCIEHAVEISKKCTSYEMLLEEIDGKIGTNIQVTECIPAIFAIIKGVNGDVKLGIKTAINLGGDTDTLASIVGAILGGFNGFDALPLEFLDTILEKNPILDIKNVVNDFCELILT